MKKRRFYKNLDCYLTKKEHYDLVYKPRAMPKDYMKYINFNIFLRKNFSKRLYQYFTSSLHLKSHINCCTLKLINSFIKLSAEKKFKLFGSYKEVFGEMQRVLTLNVLGIYEGEFLYVAPFGGKIILIFKAYNSTLCFYCQSSVHIIPYSKFIERGHGSSIKGYLCGALNSSLLPKIKELHNTHPLHKIIQRSDFPITL